jgi:mannose-6-phosphate isomerase-like protein (cupin superfamily)
MTASVDPEGRGVLPAQMSRIELGQAICDLRELNLLAKALGVNPAALLGLGHEPWYVVRGDMAERMLAEVRAGKKSIIRQSGAHRAMIRAGVYTYAPLVSLLDSEGETAPRASSLEQMQSCLFMAGRCDENDMVLDHHLGEEMLWVLEGELEFWSQQQDSAEAPKRVTLLSGDSLHFSSELPHGFRATGKSDYAKALFVHATKPTPAPPAITLTGDPDIRSEA